MDPIALMFVLAMLVFMSAFYAASEIAVISLTDHQVNEIKKKHPRAGKSLESHRANANKFLINISVANNFINILASAIATAAAIALFPKYGVLIATFGMTALILMFGEILPKIIALAHTSLIARFTSIPLSISSVLLRPIIWMFEVIVKVLARETQKQEKVTEQSLRYYLTKGEELGAINKREKEYISNIMNLDKLTVESVMTAADKVTNLSVSGSVEDAIDVFASSGYSRLPVYGRHPGDIVGVLHVRDILQKSKKAKIKRYIRRPMITPTIKHIDRLLEEFQETANHFAIVVDAEGDYVGIVTFEDVLEEITGEIYDETDHKVSFTRKVGRNTYIIRGDFELRDFNKKFNRNYHGASTIKGFVVKKLRNIPQRGDIVDLDDGRFEVLNVVSNKIIRLLFKKKS
jgi:putative hemolysin